MRYSGAYTLLLYVIEPLKSIALIEINKFTGSSEPVLCSNDEIFKKPLKFVNICDRI